MLFRDHRVFECVGLVVELDDRTRKNGALLDAETLGQRAGSDVAHDDFKRDDLDFLDQLLAHVEAADKVRRDADLVQVREDVFGNTVVQHALAVDDVMLFLVEGGRVVLEELDERARLRALIEDLGLALVDTAATIHGFCLCACWRSWAARVEYLSGSIAEKNGFHNRRIFQSH